MAYLSTHDMHSKNKPVIIYFRKQGRILSPAFFGANVHIKAGGRCVSCGAKHLKRGERVDVEFFGGDLESYCLKCWPNTILSMIEADKYEKQRKAQLQKHQRAHWT